MCKINWEERTFEVAKGLLIHNEITIDDILSITEDFIFKYRSKFGKEEEEQEKVKTSGKSEKDEIFEEAWIMYRRKGSKKKAKEQWSKLTEKERENVKNHIPAYIESVSEIRYQKDFERYLRDRCFLNVVYKNGKVIFDIDEYNNNIHDNGSRLIINGQEYK